jgi:lambda repressor-like predicted transcriptional regulator
MIVKNYKMAANEMFENIIDPVWAEQHPIEALKELKSRGWSLKKLNNKGQL